ncbi:MAG: SRPBCC family protein [Desulfovibrionales bacterium]
MEGLRHPKPIQVERTVTVLRPRKDLYGFWRNFENLSVVMNHLESVTVIDSTRSHWVAKGPVGIRVEWDAAITREEENRSIDWAPVKGSEIAGGGTILFTDAPGDRGTEVKVVLSYDPPGGRLGAEFAKLFGDNPSQMVREDLRRFKQLMETGETATISGQPRG